MEQENRHKNSVVNMLGNLYRKIYKHIWWRWHYRKSLLSTEERLHGKCTYCQAKKGSTKTNRPYCHDKNLCPCEYNRCLNIK